LAALSTFAGMKRRATRQRQLLGGLATAIFAGLASAAVAAPAVQINDAVARVIVSPEPRGDIKVQVLHGNPRLPLKVWSFLGRTYIDGGLGRRLRGCGKAQGQPTATVAGVGAVPFAAMPQILIHTPLDANVSAGGAIWGQMGNARSVDLSAAGCGTWALGDVRGAMKINLAGAGEVRTGSANAVELNAAGAGSIATGPIAGPVTAMNLGAGDIDIASINGAFNARIAGTGRIRVNGGRASTMQASIAGSGGIVLNGVAGSLNASVMGSGDIRVGRVIGQVSKTVMGSGAVRVGP
jgi:hypothetical protein